MGLLSNILKAVAGKAISEVEEAINNAVSEKTRPTIREAAPQQSYSDEVPERTAAEWKTYFREILQCEYPALAIRENVPVTEIAGFVADEFQLYTTRPRQVYKAEWGQPYTFVLYEGASPKAVVMLGSGHSHDSNVKYLIARMYAKKCGLPYINFYTQMPNERSYVVSRLKKFM